jgi:hypothetical protein
VEIVGELYKPRPIKPKNHTFLHTHLAFSSSTTALIQKLGKELDDAGIVLSQMVAIEQAAGQKRAHSTGDSSSSMSRGSR